MPWVALVRIGCAVVDGASGSKFHCPREGPGQKKTTLKGLHTILEGASRFSLPSVSHTTPCFPSCSCTPCCDAFPAPPAASPRPPPGTGLFGVSSGPIVCGHCGWSGRARTLSYCMKRLSGVVDVPMDPPRRNQNTTPMAPRQPGCFFFSPET